MRKSGIFIASRRFRMTSAPSASRSETCHVKPPRHTTRGISSLMYASQQGDIQKVRHLIRTEPTALYEKDRTGKSPLHYCCTSNNIYAVQAADYLVMAAPDLMEARDDDGFSPLHLAVIAGNMPLITFLLANNADVNAVDDEKHTVVHWATVCGEISALRVVLAAGAPVSTPDVHGGYPLHYAAQMCGGEKDSNMGLQVLQALLSHKDIDVTVKDDDGRQPLLWAASAGSTKAVLTLIRAGAAVEEPDKDGLTALHCAASRGHTDCIDSLLTLCGASVDVIDTNGCTALHYAVTLGHADATALLLAHGADPNRQDRKGRTPAHCGCAKGQFETVKLIAGQGANLWMRNARGDLPLHEAAASGRRELVKWLLEMRPSQVNARNNDGRCPLHLAAMNDNVDMCKILLDIGAKVNPVLRTSKNVFMTPLDCALQKGYRSTAKYLQLQGGVPASRLGVVPPQFVSKKPANLQKEMTSFWQDSSSESEEENAKLKPKTTRQKISKFEKKRASLSGSSDYENVKALNKLDKDNNVNKQNVKKATKKSNETTAKIEEKQINSTRIDYVNEIIINGRTEINIHETKEITIGAGETRIKSENNITKRPKSAKIKETIDKDQSIDRSSKIDETEDQKILQKIIGDVTPQQEDKNKTDQKPSTSEKINKPELIITEASIHAPPKEETQSKEIIDETKDATSKTDEVKETSKVEKDNKSNQVTQNSLKIEDKKEEHLTVQQEDSKTQESQENSHDPLKVMENTENITKQEMEIQRKDEEQEIQRKVETEQKNQETTETATDKQSKEEEKEEIERKTNMENDRQIKTSTKLHVEQISSEKDEESQKEHKSFRVLEESEMNKTRTERKTIRKQRSHSEDNKITIKHDKLGKSTKIPISKNDKHLLNLPNRNIKSSMESSRVPSLPNIHENQIRSELNISAPNLIYNSDNEPSSESHLAEGGRRRKRRIKRKSKTREAKSAGSDYESSNIIDSGFEPSPRSTQIPKWRNMSERGVNMTSVTQSIQSNIRRYHLERKIFQHLLELKRLQIRADQHNEAVLVKRAIDAYHQSCASTVGAGRYIPDDLTFRSFEKFLYHSLRKLQRNGDFLKGLPESPNPIQCIKSTNRCMHAIHAYTGIPCAAYLPRMDHHTIPKIGFEDCKPSTGGFLPTINSKKAVTLELCHGADKQIISLPTDRLNQNKRYYVTFTVKGNDLSSSNEEHPSTTGHRHSKSY